MDRVIVITGTRKGIGNYLAQCYLEEGNYHHTCLNVADEEAVVAWVRQIYKEQKRIDVLINNAGIASMNHVLLTPGSTAQKVMGTNFMGTFLMSREVAKYMMRRKEGRIVNYSTVAVPSPRPR